MKVRAAYFGVFTALALIFSYVESLIPFSFGIPGMKLGLPNLIVLLLLYERPGTGKNPSKDGQNHMAAEEKIFSTGVREAVLVNGLRIILSGFLFSNLYAILYALSGAALSLSAMLAGKKYGRFSMIGVSVLGGVFHNVGQILVAMAVVETFAVAYYLPFLIVAGTVTGAVLGFAGMELVPYLRRPVS